MSFPPSRIIVSYDFTSRCREAWRYAQELGRRLGGAVEAVHVRDWLDPYGAAIREALPAAARSALEQAMVAQIPGLTREACHVLSGATADCILSLANARGAGMIVVPTEGREGARRFLPGSSAEAIVRGSKLPVLTVHEGAGEIRSVLVPVELAGGGRAGLELAARYASELRASLTVLHVVSGKFSARGALKRLESLLAAMPARLREAVRPEVKIAEGEAGQRVIEESASHGLLVLPLREALGETAERVLRYSRAPVLTLPEAA